MQDKHVQTENWSFLTQWKKLAVFLLFLALILCRAPQLLLTPRFWAEEASLYLRYAYENSFLDALFFVHQGTAAYLALSANIPTAAAAHLFPLAYAPAVTTYFSLCVLLIPFGIILWGRSRLWQTAGKKVLACFIVLLASLIPAASYEIWLNSINLQVYCGIISSLILFEKLDNLTRLRKQLYRVLLVFCGLSGVYTTFLALGFFLKWLLERSKESFLHFIIVTLTSAVQLGIYIYVKYSGAFPPTRLEFDWLKTPIYILYSHIISPLFGEHNANAMLSSVSGTSYIEIFAERLSREHMLFYSVSLCCLICIILILFFLAKYRNSPYSLILIVCFPMLSVLTAYGALHGVPTGRYAVVPGTLFLFMLLDKIRFTRPFKTGSLAILLLLCFSLLFSISEYRQGSFLTYTKNAPLWQEELAAWQRNPDYKMTVWPYPRWKFYLSNRDMVKAARKQIRAAHDFTVECGPNTQEKYTSVNGLPVGFYIGFDLSVQGDYQDCNIELVLLGENNVLYAARSLKHHIKNYRVSLKVHSGHFLGLQKAGYRYADVKKIVFRFHSKGKPAQVSVSNQDLNVMKLGVFRLID